MMETKQIKINGKGFEVDNRSEFKGYKISPASEKQLFFIGQLVGLKAEGAKGSKTPNKAIKALKLNKHQANQIVTVLLSEQKAATKLNRIAKAKSFLASQGITSW